MRTSAVHVEDVDLYKVCMDVKRVERFTQIVTLLKKEAVIYNESIQDFRIEAKREPFSGAAELRDVMRGKFAFTDAFKKYGSPYKYLGELLSIETDIQNIFWVSNRQDALLS